METQSLDLVLSQPGIYVFFAGRALGFCEVDPDGRCYQLRPHDFSRDDELRPGYWRIENRITFIGPLARVSS